MSNKTTWDKTRKFFNDIHLWGGLISGLVVLAVCLSGTIYVYNTELREAALPKYYKAVKTGDKLSPDSLLAIAKSQIKGDVVGIKVPFAEGVTTAVLFNKPEKEKAGTAPKEKEQAAEKAVVAESKVATGNTLVSPNVVAEKPETKGDAAVKKGDKAKAAPAQGGGRRRSNQMMVNPYTGELIGDASEEKTKTAAFMQQMFGLHRWLLLNEIEEPIFDGIENRKLGSWISGTATLLFLLGVLSGLVIWFPKKMRAWKNGLSVRWSGSWKRINHDLHNTLGLYTWIFLFLMSVTGPFWSFEWYREGWQKTWGTYQDPKAGKEEKPKLASTYVLGKSAMSIEETILQVNKLLPYEGDITVNFAKDSTGTVSVTKSRVGFFAPSASDKLTLDQYSGALLEKDIFREKSFRNRIGSSVKALHIGDVYGQFSKLLYFISCLVATSLPVTGVFIWINKMKKKKGPRRSRA